MQDGSISYQLDFFFFLPSFLTVSLLMSAMLYRAIIKNINFKGSPCKENILRIGDRPPECVEENICSLEKAIKPFHNKAGVLAVCFQFIFSGHFQVISGPGKFGLGKGNWV